MVRQLASRPPNVFDSYALIGALEHLEDVGRRAGHADLKKFSAVLSSCKKLPPSPRLGDLVTNLLGDDIEKEVSKTVARMYKSSTPAPWMSSISGSGYPRPSPGWPYPRGRGRRPPSGNAVRCYRCQRFGHFARSCPNQ